MRPAFDQVGLMLPNASPLALPALALAGFAALRVFRLSNPVAAFLALIAATYYYIPPTGVGWYDTHWCRKLLLLPIAAAPFAYAIRSARENREQDYECGYLPTLDGWRAIAVAIVLLDHLRASEAITGKTLSFFLFRGPHGVNLFFGISGFLITWKLLCEHRDRGTISLGSFYRRRIFRILPAASLFLVVACIVFPQIGTGELASCVLFYRNLAQGFRTTLVTSHYWSLSVEEQFYLCLPALFILLSPKRLRVCAIAMTVACAAWRWLYLPSDPANLDIWLTFRTDLRIDGLLCGCLLAFAFHDDRVRNWLLRATSGAKWWVALAAYCGMIVLYRKYTTLTESVLVAVIIGGTVLHPHRAVSRVLESRPFKMIGRMSYGIYLWQQPLCFVPRLHLRPAWLAAFPFNILAALAIATVSYYAFERPILRASRRFARKQVPELDRPHVDVNTAKQLEYAGV